MLTIKPATHLLQANALGSQLHNVKIPAMVPVKQVAKVPAISDLGASAIISCLRLGHILERPAIIMPRLPKLAKPHIA